MTGLSHQPRATATAAAATDDDPDALVSPAPRSHTSTRQVVSPVDAHELDVRPLAGTADASRAAARAGAGRSRVGVVEPDDRVRVADRRASSARRPSTSISGSPTATSPMSVSVSSASSIRASISPSAVVIDDLARARRGGEPARGDAHPVARHLGGRAVGVPDRDVGSTIVVRRRSRGRRRSRCPSRRSRDVARARRSAARHRAARRRGSCYRARATSRNARRRVSVAGGIPGKPTPVCIRVRTRA